MKFFGPLSTLLLLVDGLWITWPQRFAFFALRGYGQWIFGVLSLVAGLYWLFSWKKMKRQSM